MRTGRDARVARRPDKEGSEGMSSPPPVWPGSGLENRLERR